MIQVDIYDLLWDDVVTRMAVVYQNRFLPRRLHLKQNKTVITHPNGKHFSNQKLHFTSP